MTPEAAYNSYKDEAEKYFVTRFIDTDKEGNQVTSMIDKIKRSLEVVLNLKKDPVQKGLCLYSPSFGQGKTFFFEVVYHRAERLGNKKLFKQTTAKELRKVFVEKGSQALDEFINTKCLFIDDIGAEDGKAAHYGDGLEVIRHVITERYELWLQKGYVTHYTTNLIFTEPKTGKANFDEVVKRYDGRLADRLKHMTEFVEYEFLKGGASFRQVKSTRRLSKEEKEKPEETGDIPLDKEAHERDFLKYIEVLAEEHRAGKLNAHWHDFKVIYDFLEGKGVKFREPSQEDREAALTLIRGDSVITGRGMVSKPSSGSLKNSGLDLTNAIRSVICREYFTKLAVSNFKFSEAKDFP